MKHNWLVPALFVAVPFSVHAQAWQDASKATPDAPPAELLAQQASEAAPGAAAAVDQAAPVAPRQSAPVSTRSADDGRPAVTVTTSTRKASKSNTYALVLHSTALRARPTASGTGDDIIAADTRVRLESSLNNGDGKWWFVTATGVGGGWVLESELGTPQQD